MPKRKKSRRNRLSLDQISTTLISIWRRNVSAEGPSDLLQTREFRSCVGQTIELYKLLESQSEVDWARKRILSPYLLYFWTKRFLEARALIKKYQLPSHSSLDLAAGLSPYGIASLEAGASEVYAIEQRQELLHMLSRLSAELGLTLSVRRGHILKANEAFERSYDLITLSHNLYSITQDQEVLTELIRSKLKLLNPGGKFLIVDRSSSSTKTLFKKLHQTFLNEGYSSRLEFDYNPYEETTQVIQDIEMRMPSLQEMHSDILLLGQKD